MPTRRFRKITNARGMTLLEVVIAAGLVGLIAGPLMFLLFTMGQKYGVVVTKKAIFPLADEVRMAVAFDMKTYFTTTKPNPPCSGQGNAIPLPSTQPLRSGNSLRLITKAEARALPRIQDFPIYNNALRFCSGDAGAPILAYPPVTFSPLPAGMPWDIFNPPPFDYSNYTSFDFCGVMTCNTAAGNPTAFSRTCLVSGDNARPLLVVLRYVIRLTTNGSALTCDDVATTWPRGAAGELTYLFAWTKPMSNGPPVFLNDSGVFYSNSGVNQ